MNSVRDLVVSCVDEHHRTLCITGSLEQVVQGCGIVGDSVANGTVRSGGEKGVRWVGFVLGFGPLIEFAVLLESGGLGEVRLIAVLVLAWSIGSVRVTLEPVSTRPTSGSV